MGELAIASLSTMVRTSHAKKRMNGHSIRWRAGQAAEDCAAAESDEAASDDLPVLNMSGTGMSCRNGATPSFPPQTIAFLRQHFGKTLVHQFIL